MKTSRESALEINFKKMFNPTDPLTQSYIEATKNSPEPKITMGDDEFMIQLTKIFLGCVIGIFTLVILFHINHNLTTIIKQNGEIIQIWKDGRMK